MLEPDARIDLHGMTQGAAHRTLFAWLAAAHSRGHRLVLVITGKGNPKNDENAPWMMSPHGVLKQMVPRWLNEPELAALIASVQPAHARHGGGGALYVYLRKIAMKQHSTPSPCRPAGRGFMNAPMRWRILCGTPRSRTGC